MPARVPKPSQIEDVSHELVGEDIVWRPHKPGTRPDEELVHEVVRLNPYIHGTAAIARVLGWSEKRVAASLKNISRAEILNVGSTSRPRLVVM